MNTIYEYYIDLVHIDGHRAGDGLTACWEMDGKN